MENTKKDSMVFFRSFYEALKDLPLETKCAALSAIIEYGLDGKVPLELDVCEKVAFSLAKPIIDNSNERYRKCIENGKKGGRPRKKQAGTESSRVIIETNIYTETDTRNEEQEDSVEEC